MDDPPAATENDQVDWKELRRRKKEWKKQQKLNQEKEIFQNNQEEFASEFEPKKKKQAKRIEIDSINGRRWTISIALPGSILSAAHSPQLQTYLVGQIARAAVVFSIDEIVVYDEHAGTDSMDSRRKCVELMAKILEFQECPQYFRKDLFPVQQDLQFAGLLNPLGCPHHLKAHELDLPYREGVVQNSRATSTKGSLVYVGLDTLVEIEQALEAGVRVTVKVDPQELNSGKRVIPGEAVSPSEPRSKLGLYWGYSVRIADSLSDALNSGHWEYDLKLGTSDKGQDIDKVTSKLRRKFNHCIIVFGGIGGIESAFPEEFDVQKQFDFYLNTCADQGSHCIKTEEALLITMAKLRPILAKNK
jgi:hypothetical protein